MVVRNFVIVHHQHALGLAGHGGAVGDDDERRCQLAVEFVAERNHIRAVAAGERGVAREDTFGQCAECYHRRYANSDTEAGE